MNMNVMIWKRTIFLDITLFSTSLLETWYDDGVALTVWMTTGHWCQLVRERHENAMIKIDKFGWAYRLLLAVKHRVDDDCPELFFVQLGPASDFELHSDWWLRRKINTPYDHTVFLRGKPITTFPTFRMSLKVLVLALALTSESMALVLALNT